MILTKSDTNLDEKANSDSLGSISAIVIRKLESKIFANYDLETYNSNEDRAIYFQMTQDDQFDWLL